MKKIVIGIACTVFSVSMLTGCGLLTDTQNYNFNKDGVPILDDDGNEISVEVIKNRNTTAEIYLDSTQGMKEIVDDSRVQGIVQDSVDAVTKSWNDVTSTFYTVDNDSIDPQPSISIVNDLASITYGGSANDIIVRAVESTPNISNEKVIEPRLKLIVTDLKSQLQDYQALAANLDKNLMQKNKSFAILSVKTEKPFFIVAIGALSDLSEYLDEFYSMPHVTEFNPNMTWNAADQERPINCKIYAQNSGIAGVDFDRISYEERGNYEVDKDGNVVTSGGMMDMGDMPAPPPEVGLNGPDAPGRPGGPGAPGSAPQNGNGQAPPELPGGIKLIDDDKGSFSILRPDYEPKYLTTNIEGTVNFAPEDFANSSLNLDRSIEVELPSNVDSDDLKVEDVHYIGFKSLLWSKSEYLDNVNNKIAGKVKIIIPFNSINQIQLSDLQFDSSTSYYDANKGDSEFFESDKSIKNNIEVAFANNTGPTEAMWRIDNQDKTLMVNIYVNDLLDLSYATKLDITVGALDPGKLPVWVKSWSAKSEFKNLENLISLLNDYNTKDNRYEETITVYLMAGDGDVDAEISSEPFLANDSTDDQEVLEKHNWSTDNNAAVEDKRPENKPVDGKAPEEDTRVMSRGADENKTEDMPTR